MSGLRDRLGALVPGQGDGDASGHADAIRALQQQVADLSAVVQRLDQPDSCGPATNVRTELVERFDRLDVRIASLEAAVASLVRVVAPPTPDDVR